jgi:hypothetical protein
MATSRRRGCNSNTSYFAYFFRIVLNSGSFMVSTVLPKAPLRRPPHPQIGDSARLWNYVEAKWIEGKIESIQPEYRVLVRSVKGLDETVGWHLALQEDAWVEDVALATGTKA